LTDPFVRVELSCTGGKKLKKKRTSTKKATSNPTWNEALVFNLHHGGPGAAGREVTLAGMSIELLVLSDGLLGISEPLGRVTVSDQSSGTELSHWHELLAVRNAPARWHTLHAVTSVSE